MGAVLSECFSLSPLAARVGSTSSPPQPIADADKRAVIKRALERVIVLPHPAGRAASHLDWARRSALLSDRLRLHWL
jgi:hypothetical protein